MNNIIKINKPLFHVGFSSKKDMENSLTMRDFLVENKIPYEMSMYAESDNHAALFDFYGTWSFGLNYESYVFTEFPFLTWEEQFDNYDAIQCVAFTIDGIKASRLLANLEQIDTKKRP